jgi:amino acid permease
MEYNSIFYEFISIVSRLVSHLVIRFPFIFHILRVICLQNVVATYIGVALYILLYSGYTIYERFYLKCTTYFVPTHEVDLITDAVWGPGEGAAILEKDDESSSVPVRERIAEWVKSPSIVALKTRAR